MSNFSILIFLVSFLTIAGCTEENKVQLPELIAGNEIIAVPEFSIEIALTDEARQKLRQSGESIKGAIHFDGDGASLKEVKTAPFRDVYLGKYDFELKTEGSLHIEDASISHEAYSRLKDENYHYFVNAYTMTIFWIVMLFTVGFKV